MSKLFCLLLISNVILCSNARECRWSNFDLTPLSNDVIECYFENYVLTYTPCRNALNCNGFGNYMVTQEGIQAGCWYLGNWNDNIKPEKIDINDEKGFLLTYNNGEIDEGCPVGRNIDVFFICDNSYDVNDVTNIDCNEENIDCNYYIKIYSEIGCGSTRLSYGTLFLISFFGILIGYCIIGCSCNKCKHIPNYPMWITLPYAIKEGCQISYQCCVKKWGKNDSDSDNSGEIYGEISGEMTTTYQ